MTITIVNLDEIVIGDRLRALDRDAVDRLKESIKRLGEIKTPLSVRLISSDEGWSLITGRHRYQAAIELEMKEVPVRIETGTELDARLGATPPFACNKPNGVCGYGACKIQGRCLQSPVSA